MESEDDAEDSSQMEFQVVRNKRKRHKKLNKEDIENIIGVSSSDTDKNTTNNSQFKKPYQEMGKNTLENIRQTKQITQKNIHTNNRNYSDKMNEILNKKFKHLFYFTTGNTQTRISMADLWELEHPQSKDVIIKTKLGFLLKSDNDKKSITTTLEKLKGKKVITSFKESAPNALPSKKILQASYSVVISRVEQEISDISISEFLKSQKLDHRYCKRIVAKATNKPTSHIRIITSNQHTSENLLKNGLFYKNCHYPVYPSTPPNAAPIPCGKCSSFSHTTDNCQEQVKCTKCFGTHSVNKCTSNLQPKCLACGAEDHQSWSFKCPKRPTNPINGIPNIPIKSLNKKSEDLPDSLKKTNIHKPITKHDYIINAYINTLNDENNANIKREELVQKLRKKFINNFNIDTQVLFTGNRMYILMFDLDNPDTDSPTRPIHEDKNIQFVQNVTP